jgi:hypothetical protein
MGEENQKKPSEAFHYCQLFRRMAKAALKLPAYDGDKDNTDEQLPRQELLEHLIDVMTELDVWTQGIVQGICLAMVLLYEGKDKEAAEMLNHLADEELNLMRGSLPEPEDGEEGAGDSE